MMLIKVDFPVLREPNIAMFTAPPEYSVALSSSVFGKRVAIS